MVWVISAPNDTTVWTVKNNYYAISDSGTAFYNAFAAAGVGIQSTSSYATTYGPEVYYKGAFATWKANSRIFANTSDTVNDFQRVTVKLTTAPSLMTTMLRWYRSPSGGNKTKSTTNWSAAYDYNRKKLTYYTDTLNCSFKASVNLSAASTDGTVIGATRWSYLGSTGVEKVSSLSPGKFSLDQNYPNPFNPSTKFNVNVPEKSIVSVKVFDILGREVANLMNGEKTAATYVVTWDAASMPSGVYFYQLKAGTYTETKKMLLVK
jgi:hypothetical protein